MTQSIQGALLLMQTAGDSATTRIMVESGWLASLASVGQLVVSVLVTVMLVMIVLMLFALKRSLDELTKLVKGAYEPVRSVLQEARDVTAEVHKLTQTIQAPVARIVETADHASSRVRGALVRVEQRLERLDELAGIVQEEAEEFVVKSASLARGVRVGGLALRAAFVGGQNRKSKHPQRPNGRQAREEVIEDVESEGSHARVTDLVGPRIRPRTLPAP